MIYDLQKASMMKRVAAWLFDVILTATLAVGFGLLLSVLLGYDAHNDKMEAAFAGYETEYGVVFDVTQEEYLAMTEAQQKNYEEAYAALTSDQEFLYEYNMTVNLSLMITSLGILLAMLAWEFVLPLVFGNGQTLGKKIFGLCLIRNDGVRVNTMQLFTRTLLGKFTIETMIPVYVLLMIFWNAMGIAGTILLAALLVGQLICLCATRTNSALHDLLAGTVVADITSQMIFRSTEELVEFQKQVAAERAARQTY